MKMSRKPTITPSVAPTIGISEVAQINTEITVAFGKRNTVMPIKQSNPRMTDSVSCPPINFEKQPYVREET